MKLKSDLLIQAEGEVLKKIHTDLNEDVSKRQQNITSIREWLAKQPHLPDDVDDQVIITFLRGACFSIERAKKKIDMYYTMRGACPELFTNRDATSKIMSEVLHEKVQGPPLPKLTPNGRRVTVCRGIHQHLDTNQITESLKITLMMGDIRLMEETEGVAGDIYILDAAVLAPSLLARLSPSIVKKFLICVQEAYPVKLKEVHIINTQPVVERVLSFIKPFLKDKMKQRIFVHRTHNELYKYVPKEILPKEYGGDCESVDELHVQWIKKLEEYKDYFKAQESVKANEELRPGKPTNYDELFGIEGTFRKLDID